MPQNITHCIAAICFPGTVLNWLCYLKPLFFIIALGFTTNAWAQTGCTDPQSDDYDPAAITNDGSCTYPPTSYTLSNPKQLPATLNETSGLIYTDNQLWTLNDSGSSPVIYRISETDGSILQTVSIGNATNTDWEAITADAQYFYIGDFGNNANGGRTDLKIYRVYKSSIGTAATTTVTADIINFYYPEQGTPVATNPNNTKFDCEAFLVKNNRFHLFTKDWVTLHTVHYSLPVTPGTYPAQRHEEFYVNGLITDAHISTTNKNEIVLIGYTASSFPDLFMWLLFDYSGDNFFSGNKRRIELGRSIQGQIEGVTFTSNGNGYISSERISDTVFGFPVDVPPRLFSFSTTSWVPLPVELLYFKVDYTAPVVKLTWQTATEIQNDFFSVESATDALTFKELNQIKGAGNSTSIQSYSFTHANPTVGQNYYRLKQTDWDGTFTYSAIKSITVPGPMPFWRVSPVPVTAGQPLNIRFMSTLPPGAKISLIGLDGKVHIEKSLTNPANREENLDTKHLAPGVYILKFRSSRTVTVAKVIIK